MKLLRVMSKDLRLIVRDRSALVALILVPIVVIFFVAESQSRGGSRAIVFPVVDEDRGPVASTLIRVLGEHLDVRVVSRPEAERLVREENRAPAMLVLPRGLSKRYLTETKSTLELLTDPAQWAGLAAVRVVLLLADREAATLGDPFGEELIVLRESSLTGTRLRLSSIEQNVPGFSVMFVLLSLVYSVAFGRFDEELHGTQRRLLVAPVRPEAVLGGKVLARAIVAALQLSLLLSFGRAFYGISLGQPLAIAAAITAVALGLAGFGALVAALMRTREQVLPVGLAAVFAFASLGGCFWPYGQLPPWMQTAARGTVTAWSMFALHDVMLRGRGLAEVLPRLGVLSAYGALSFVLAVLLLRREDAR